MSDKPKTAKEIVIEYLKQNGYDGLAGDGCGCLVDNLFMFDGCGEKDCVAGHRIRYGDPGCDGERCEWAGDCMASNGLGHCVLAGKKNEQR